MGRLVNLEELERITAELKSQGSTISFANGHFDLLHVGHLRYLHAERAEGDVLVVGLNGEGSVQRLKGPVRPLVPAVERAEMLAALEPVDFIVVFDDDTPAEVLKRLQPQVHCKGTDYETSERVPEFEIVRAYGGRTVLLGDPKDHSTRDLISAARELHRAVRDR